MRRRLMIAVILTIITSIAVGGHLYMWQRLIADTELGQPWRTLGTIALVLLGASWFIQPIAAERIPAKSQRLIAWPASVWMGCAWFLVIGLLVTDAIFWLMGTPTEAATTVAHGAATAAQTQAWLVLGSAAILGGVSLISALRSPPLQRVDIALPRWPRALDGFRIVQISDIHFGPLLSHRFADHLVERCNALDPDLIVITGDLVDGPVKHVGADVAPLAGLRARHGSYFITGNHDHFSGADAWADFVANLGITVLRNRHVRIDIGETGFDIAGVDDENGSQLAGDAGYDLVTALAGRDTSRPVVLLAHDPLTFPSAVKRGVDLQISGHTHGGQIWPFMYVVRLVTPYVAGLHRRDSSQLYVSRGTGFWGPCMRLFAPSEITELTLRRAA